MGWGKGVWDEVCAGEVAWKGLCGKEGRGRINAGGGARIDVRSG